MSEPPDERAERDDPPAVDAATIVDGDDSVVDAPGDAGDLDDPGAQPMAGNEPEVSTPLDWTVLALGLLLVVAYAPPLMFDSWTPRFALLVAFVPFGVASMVELVKRRDRAAIVLVTALGWTVLVGLLSGAPRSALLGVVGRDLSAFVVVASAGVWAAARLISPGARYRMVDVVMWATAAAAVVGILQVVADVRTGPLALAFGRPYGFMSNPVYFGAVCAAGLLVAVAASGRSFALRLLPILVLSAGASVSGSRVAFGAAVVGLIAYVVVHRNRSAVLAVAVAVVGLIAGIGVDREVGAGRNAADRLVEGSGGGRTTIWRYGIEAMFDRPIRGFGFGRFRPAVQGRFEPSFVECCARDELSQAWFDPHNVVVGLVVAVGIPGLLLFTAAAVMMTLDARGPLAWGLLPLLAHWALQPVSLFTLPLAALMLGAAVAASNDEVFRWPTGRMRHVLTGAVACALVVALAMLAGDLAFRRATERGDGDTAATITSWALDDPVMSNIVSQVYPFDDNEPDPVDRLVYWRERSADVEPDRPFWWSQLALARARAGDREGAQLALDRAFALQEHNPTTLGAQAVIAIEFGDRDLLVRTLAGFCLIGLPECEFDPDELLSP